MAEEEETFDFGSKKKGSKKKKEKGETKNVQEESNWTPGPVYPYDLMITRVYEILESKNPSLGEKHKYILKPPQIVRVGSKKVAWVNFSEICGIMKRPIDHVVQFVLAEFGTEGSVAGQATSRSEGGGADGQLILKGRYQPKHCESLLRKYIKEYVTCGMCKSADTQLRKDASTRLFLVECQNCGASRSASSIKSGYHAVTRKDRKDAKAKT